MKAYQHLIVLFAILSLATACGTTNIDRDADEQTEDELGDQVPDDFGEEQDDLTNELDDELTNELDDDLEPIDEEPELPLDDVTEEPDDVDAGDEGSGDPLSDLLGGLLGGGSGNGSDGGQSGGLEDILGGLLGGGSNSGGGSGGGLEDLLSGLLGGEAGGDGGICTSEDSCGEGFGCDALNLPLDQVPVPGLDLPVGQCRATCDVLECGIMELLGQSCCDNPEYRCEPVVDVNDVASSTAFCRPATDQGFDI